MTSINYRQQLWSHHLPNLISCNGRQQQVEFIYMHRPYYQRGLGLQGHMVTDWVDWLQVCFSLMPGGLSLQMSLSLLTVRKNILLSVSFMSSFIVFLSSLSVILFFSLLYLQLFLFLLSLIFLTGNCMQVELLPWLISLHLCLLVLLY